MECSGDYADYSCDWRSLTGRTLPVSVSDVSGKGRIRRYQLLSVNYLVHWSHIRSMGGPLGGSIT